MKAIMRRLERLERRVGLAEVVESWEDRQLRKRLEAARLRTESLPISAARQAELRGMTIVEILNSSRDLDGFVADAEENDD
jgi:hypothetical protein